MLDDHQSLLAKQARFHAGETLPTSGFVDEDKSALEASY